VRHEDGDLPDRTNLTFEKQNFSSNIATLWGDLKGWWDHLLFFSYLYH
jgi:hypothetical protein